MLNRDEGAIPADSNFLLDIFEIERTGDTRVDALFVSFDLPVEGLGARIKPL